MRPDLTVVIPTLNGRAGLDRCLSALEAQSLRRSMEIIVVDDGSTDGTAAVARSHGVTVISHPRNLGISAARNTGLDAAAADIVAFLDDDCEPETGWARKLVTGYAQDDIVGVCGEIIPRSQPGYLRGFLTRNNPLVPLELELVDGHSIPYRFYLYLRRQWSGSGRTGERDVYSFVGANMSFRTKTLFDVGQFDERFRFGADELDLCMRIRQAFPDARLVFVPDARVFHHFKPQLRDTLRRSRSYGMGSARLHRKWPALSPTVFPAPLLVVLLLGLASWVPGFAIAAALAPLVLYPRGVRLMVSSRQISALLDPYVRLAQEACEDIGIAQGAWRFRQLTTERARGVPNRPEAEQSL